MAKTVCRCSNDVKAAIASERMLAYSTWLTQRQSDLRVGGQAKRMNAGENDWESLYESLQTVPTREGAMPLMCEHLDAERQELIQPVNFGPSLLERDATRASSPGGPMASGRAFRRNRKGRPSASGRGAGKGLGKALQKRRHELALTQRQLAARVGVKAAHIAYIEGDRRRPSLGLLSRIADALGFDREKLFTLAHPEASLLIRPKRQVKVSSEKDEAWMKFTRDRSLLARHQVKTNELKILAQVNLLGRVSAPRNYMFILNAIRQAVEEE